MKYVSFVHYIRIVVTGWSSTEELNCADISYEMLVHKKRYEAAFYQLPSKTDTLETQTALKNKLLEKFTQEQLENPTEEQLSDIKYEAMMFMLDLCSKRSVWFLIDEKYGKYRIVMYYDNEYNHSDGEDL